jgi:hypothetical protein
VGFSVPGSLNVISASGGGVTIWNCFGGEGGVTIWNCFGGEGGVTIWNCFGGEGGGIGDAGGKGGDVAGSSSVFGGVEDGKCSLSLFAGPGVGLRPSRKAFAMSAAFHFA